jgi:hypothetical protein
MLWIASAHAGLDPESNALGQSAFGSTEYCTLPVARSLLVRLDVQH